MKVILAFLILFLGMACTKKDSRSETPVYSMGFTPAENAEVVNSNGKLITDIIFKKTGIKIKTYLATDYTALIEAMRGGHVNFAWLAPFGYVLAEKRADARILLKSVRHGHAYFYACIFVRKDSPYKTIKDLKGKNIAWVDPASTSGYIMPKAGLLDLGIDADKFFGKQVFAGGHDSVLLAVLNGTVDAGATFTNDVKGESAAWTMLSNSRPEYKDKVRIVYVTKPIPNDTFSTTQKFYREHPDVVNKVTDVIKHLHDSPEGKEALRRLYRIDSFLPAKAEEFEPLKKAAEKLHIEFAK